MKLYSYYVVYSKDRTLSSAVVDLNKPITGETELDDIIDTIKEEYGDDKNVVILSWTLMSDPEAKDSDDKYIEGYSAGFKAGKEFTLKELEAFLRENEE